MTTEKASRAQIVNALITMANATTRRLASLFPGYFQDHKHNHYVDYGWPTQLSFALYFDMYCRNSLAKAGVNKTARKVWQDAPRIREWEKEHKETEIEKSIRQRFDDLRLWRHLAEADRRSMVGSYAAVVLRVGDGKALREPVDRVSGGLNGLVEVIPAWEGQLLVADWDTNETSETYGQPTMFTFNEASVDQNQAKARSFEVHPDRVIVWSDDGTVHGRSLLEAGYNDLMTIEKIVGAGGEGFWKNAKSAPVVQVDKEAQIDQMAQAMGVSKDELVEAMNEQVENWQKGFDKLLMGQGMEFKTLGVTLPSPEHFYNIALQNYAASIEMPTKILVGMQTGERASSEDAKEWAQTCMGRRSDIVIPNIMALINRLERFGILPERDWFIDWTDLTESSMGEKVDRAGKMADINQKHLTRGSEIVFTSDEIRDVVDLPPLSDADRYLDDFDNTDDEGNPV